MDEDWDEELPDGEKPDEEPESSVDDILEAARRGGCITAPERVRPVIGSQQPVRAGQSSAEPRLDQSRTLRRCSTCGALAYGWHGTGGTDLRGHLPPEDSEDVDSEPLGDELYDQLAVAAHATRLDKWLEWGPNEWRTIPGFSNYEMNGYTREVRRPARVQILRNGRPREYPAKEIKARKSTVTLSNDDGPKSHGIEKLWRLTFAEYVTDPNSWNVHSLRRDNIPEEFGRVIKIRR